MKKSIDPSSFEALDETHRQIHTHLLRLQELAKRLAQDEPTEADRKAAGSIETFFSKTSRQHHEQEELNVFPGLLNGADEELANAVRTLRQDHGFIEENWLELGAQLRAMASGNQWVDPTELQHNLEVFTDLCLSHIALEESLIYPEAKARHQQLLARKKA